MINPIVYHVVGGDYVQPDTASWLQVVCSSPVFCDSQSYGEKTLDVDLQYLPRVLFVIDSLGSYQNRSLLRDSLQVLAVSCQIRWKKSEEI